MLPEDLKPKVAFKLEPQPGLEISVGKLFLLQLGPRMAFLRLPLVGEAYVDPDLQTFTPWPALKANGQV